MYVGAKTSVKQVLFGARGLKSLFMQLWIDLAGNVMLLSPIRDMYILLTKREVKMTGYWPSSLFAFLWTETKSRSIKTQKENEANI